MTEILTNIKGDLFWKNAAGQYHREDGPAIVYRNGIQKWFINGKRHREDGPAWIEANNFHSWWINGEYVSDSVNAWIEENKFPHWSEWTDSHKLMFRLAFSGNKS